MTWKCLVCNLNWQCSRRPHREVVETSYRGKCLTLAEYERNWRFQSKWWWCCYSKTKSIDGIQCLCFLCVECWNFEKAPLPPLTPQPKGQNCQPTPYYTPLRHPLKFHFKNLSSLPGWMSSSFTVIRSDFKLVTVSQFVVKLASLGKNNFCASSLAIQQLHLEWDRKGTGFVHGVATNFFYKIKAKISVQPPSNTCTLTPA